MTYQQADEPVRVLIVEGTAELRSFLARLVDNHRQLSLVAAAGTMSQALELAQARQPDVILLDASLGEGDLTENTRGLYRVAPHSETILLLAEGDMEGLRKAAGAQARAFLLKPLDEESVSRTIRDVYEAQIHRRGAPVDAVSAAGNGRQHGQIISVFSPKGGVGCTTIATNLAVALKALVKKGTVLVDGSLESGDVGVFLNLTPRYTLSDLVPRIGDLDMRLMEDVLIDHSSGLRALLAPTDLNDVAGVSADHMRAVLEALRSMFGCVLVDAGHSYDEVTLSVLDLSDCVLLVSTPEMAALRSVKRFYALAKQLGYPPEKLMLVLNRFPSTGGIKLNDIEEHLKLNVATSIPSDGRLVTAAVNEGVPLMMHEGGSRVGTGIAQLAKLLIRELPLESEEASAPVAVNPKALVAAGGSRMLWPFKRS